MVKNYTETVLQAISEALNAGRYDVMTVITVVITVIVFFIVISLILKFRNKKRIIKSSEASYQHLIRKSNLTILETDLITKLASTLRSPEMKYLLLVNKAKFNSAVQKIGELSEKELSLLKSIEAKTGFASSAKLKDYSSTKSFSRGMPVYLELESKENHPGEIYSISDSDIIIKLPAGRQIIPDNKLRLYSFSPYGLKTYILNIEKTKEGLISARHAE